MQFTLVVLIIVGMWTAVVFGENFMFPSSNGNRSLMRLSASFSVASPASDSNVSLPVRGSFDDSSITFADNFVIVPKSSRTEQSITQGISQMTLQLDRVIASEGKSSEHAENAIFSPASISMALALVMLGARGQTLHEVTKVLGLPPSSADNTSENNDLIHRRFGVLLSKFQRSPGGSGPTQISIANAIFIQNDYQINYRFKKLSTELYRSDVVPVDFNRQAGAAGQKINRWVEAKTAGRIREFLSSPPAAETRVLLASAIYFNGEWETPFPIEATKKRPFYVRGSKENLADSEVVDVDMMANGGEFPHHNDPDIGCQIVGLPYKGNQTTMYIVLPNVRGYEGLNALKETLAVPVLERLVSNMRLSSVILTLPRMKLEASVNLRSTLENMGLTSLFDARTADLGGLSSGVDRTASFPSRRPVGDSRDEPDREIFTFSRIGSGNEASGGESGQKRSALRDGRARRVPRQSTNTNPGLYVDDVVHKVEIYVTETGTVASAATAISISRDGGHRVVRVDRPFLFFIRHDDSKLILFWGSIVRPT